MIQKLTKREATMNDIDQVPVSKLQKIANRSKSIGMYNKQIVSLTRLLDRKEICVINGTDELPKQQIEEILQQHSAKIVQNPMNTTFCVIVGNNKTVGNYIYIFFSATLSNSSATPTRLQPSN